MRIKVVPRSDVRVTKKSTSKFKPLVDALQKLEPKGDALEVTFSNEKELGSMRNVVYSYMRATGIKIKSGKDASSGKAYFWRDK